MRDVLEVTAKFYAETVTAIEGLGVLCEECVRDVLEATSELHAEMAKAAKMLKIEMPYE